MSTFRIKIDAKYPEDNEYRLSDAIVVTGPEIPKYTLSVMEGDRTLLSFTAESWQLDGGNAMQRIEALDKLLSLDLGEVAALLEQVDGHLGLAVHRGEGSSPRWKEEAGEYIDALRSTAKVLKETL